jgi:hypothetical protein
MPDFIERSIETHLHMDVSHWFAMGIASATCPNG